MVFLSADRDGFEGLRGWKEVVMQKLGEERIADRLQEALVSSPYSVCEYPHLSIDRWIGPCLTD